MSTSDSKVADTTTRVSQRARSADFLSSSSTDVGNTSVSRAASPTGRTLARLRQLQPTLERLGITYAEPGRVARYARDFAANQLRGKIQRRGVRAVVGRIDELPINDPLLGRVARTWQRNSPELPATPTTLSLPPWARVDRWHDRRTCYEVRDVIVHARHGVVVTHDHRILRESYGNLSALLGWGGTLPDLRTRPIGSCDLDSPLYVVPSSGGFFHFVFEYLPSLLYLNESEQGRFTIGLVERAPTYVRDAVNLFLTLNPHVRLLTLPDGPIRSRSTLVAGQSELSGAIRNDDLIRLNEFGRGLCRTANAQGPSAVYATRIGERRGPTNEAVLTNALRDFNIQDVCFARLSLREQIELMQNARLLIAPHGAALSNMVWQPADSAVIEIGDPRRAVSAFALAASNAGMRYGYVPSIVSANELHADIDRVLDTVAIHLQADSSG